MKILLKIIIVFLLSLPPIYGQWENVTSNLPSDMTGRVIDAIDEYNAVIGLAGSPNSNLYKTANGGYSWDLISFPESVYPIDIDMKSTDKIWIADGNGAIYHTPDGGVSWVQQFKDNSLTNFINYIEMFDTLNGIAMGDGIASDPNNTDVPALFLRTVDGGENWLSINDSAFGAYSGDTWRRMDFVNTNTGYFFESGKTPQKLYKTDDGCETWTTTGLQEYTTVIKFYDENIGISAGKSGEMATTVDGGNNWNVIQIDSHWGNDIEFIPDNPKEVWFVSNKVYFSSDTGKTWIDYSFTDDGATFRDIKFVDSNNGWMISDNAVYRTTNNGGQVTNVEDDAVPKRFELKQNYPNPFNPSTVIEYSIGSHDVGTSNKSVQSLCITTELTVFNLLGQRIKTLVNENQSPGNYKVTFNASHMPSGIYFYTLKAGSQLLTKKMLLTK